MYLSRFGVKNYKCLGDIDIPLTPIHVLIGQNDCGKTSLLEAMAAFYSTGEKPVSEVFPEPWAGPELVRHGARERRVELWGEWANLAAGDLSSAFPTFRYGLSVDFPPPDHRSLHTRNGWTETNGERHPFPPGQALRDSLGEDRVRNEASALSMVLIPAHQYALDASQMALPAGFDSLRRFRLAPDGFGLATLLDDILSFDPNRFLQIQGEFCGFFPQFRKVQLETEYGIDRTVTADGLPQSSRVTGKGIYLEMNSGQRVRARHASDGAILFLGLLALAHSPQQPGSLLLEEPENGVYPMRLGQIIKLLKQMVTRTEGVQFPQIVITTHSPYVLSFFEPEEVTLLSRMSGEPDAPVRARPLRDAPNIRERLGNDFYLGELWYNLSEGELFGDEPRQSCD